MSSATSLFQIGISYNQIFLLVAALAVSAKLLQSLYISNRKNARLPPGPRGPPFIGMTREMLNPTITPWYLFDEWSKKYNAPHILSVKTLGQTTLIINSFQAINDLMEKRQRIYNGRPRDVFEVEIVRKGMMLAGISDPEHVTKLRNLLHEDLSASGSRAAQPIQTDEARKLAAELLKRPTEYVDCIRESQRSFIVRLTIHSTRSLSRKQLFDHMHHMQSRPAPALHPFLQLWPMLRYLPRWFPGADFYRVGQQYYAEDEKVWLQILNDCKKEMADGKAPHSVLGRWLQTDAVSRYGLSETEIAFTASNLLGAGGELPDVTLRIVILAMLHYPEKCARAQAEIDAQVGRERMPAFQDRDFLPYTRALVLEVQRWRPLNPLGMPHCTLEEDEYLGMHIPKGVRLFPSLFALSRDTEVYPEPDEFVPERFLRPDGTFTKAKELPTWGFGGRKCPAKDLAEGTLFINVATLLWCFDFLAPVDESGQRILPSKDYKDWNDVRSVSPPKFDVTVKPRGTEVSMLLSAEMEILNEE